MKFVRKPSKSRFLCAAAAVAGVLLAHQSTGAADVTVMPVGDSITWGDPWGPTVYDLTADGYRGDLQSILDSRGFDYEFVGPNASGPDGFNNGATPPSSADTTDFKIDPDHLALGGSGVGAFSSVFKYNSNDILWGTQAPDHLLFHVGTNNVHRLDPNSGDYQTKLAGLRQDVSNMLNQVGSHYNNGDPNPLTAGTKTGLARIIPRDGAVQASYDYNQQLDSAVADVTADAGFKNGIRLVDMYKIEVSTLETARIAQNLSMTETAVLNAIDKDSDEFVDWMIDADASDSDGFDESMSPDAAGQEDQLEANLDLFLETRPNIEEVTDPAITDLDNPNRFSGDSGVLPDDDITFEFRRSESGPGSVDTIHPSDLGYAVLAEVWSAKFVPEPATLSLFALGGAVVFWPGCRRQTR